MNTSKMITGSFVAAAPHEHRQRDERDKRRGLKIEKQGLMSGHKNEP